MAGHSLHIGINQNDPNFYRGLKRLHGAERDATAMARIAEKQNFATCTTLLGRDAKIGVVLPEIERARQTLAAGDTFLLTYAGHGKQVPDRDNDEPTGWDQTICLYDRPLVDDLLYTYLSLFRPGVMIIMVSDSCHSGSVVSFNNSILEPEIAKEIWTTPLATNPGDAEAMPSELVPKIKAGTSAHWYDAQTRAVPPGLASSIYLANRDVYEQQQAKADKNAKAKASVLLLAACQDSQEAKDGAFHGNFTAALLEVWNGGKYLDSPAASYEHFIETIAHALNDPTQIPNLLQTGTQTPDLRKRKPFVLS